MLVGHSDSLARRAFGVTWRNSAAASTMTHFKMAGFTNGRLLGTYGDWSEKVCVVGVCRNASPRKANALVHGHSTTAGARAPTTPIVRGARQEQPRRARQGRRDGLGAWVAGFAG